MSNGKQLTLGQELGSRKEQFAAALKGSGVAPEKFMRVALTAAQQDPNVSINAQSFLNACMRAAQDGLLPDGREGAFVAFDNKIAWIPMVAGIRKRVRKSGEITTWDVTAVFGKDQFDYELGDQPFIRHKPYMPEPLPRMKDEAEADYTARLREHIDRGPLTYVYSVARLKGGDLSRDVMSRIEIELVRDTFARKDKRGQFSPAWRRSFAEMAKKTVARRHAKMLPMANEIVALLKRDDELYDMEREPPRQRMEAPRALSDRLDYLAGSYDHETGEVLSGVEASTPLPQNAASPDDLPPRRVPEPGEAAPPPIEGDEGDFPVGEAGPPDEVLLVDEPLIPIEQVGEQMARKGRRELERWITQLPADEQAHVSIAQIAAWRAIAKGVRT